MFKNKAIVILSLLSIIALLFADKAFSAEEKRIAVLFSEKLQPYEDALAGFKEAIKSDALNVVYDEFIIDAKQKDTGPLKSRIESLDPSAILTIGTKASLFARNNLTGIPIIFVMVLNPIENGVVTSLTDPGKGITGVCLNIPVEVQLKALLRIDPSIKKVAVLYNVKTRAELINELEKAVSSLGIALIAEPVSSESDVSNSLRKALSGSDSLWAFPDPLIYNPSTAQPIILETIRNNTPFMAFSSNFVKAGALAALECNYKDIGAQAGEMATKIIRKDGIEDIAIAFPRKTILIVNKRTSDTIGINIDRDILDKAVVYGN